MRELRYKEVKGLPRDLQLVGSIQTQVSDFRFHILSVKLHLLGFSLILKFLAKILKMKSIFVNLKLAVCLFLLNFFY